MRNHLTRQPQLAGPMDDSADSQQGQEKSSEECFDLTPSSRGRQRKRNVKYMDYETEDTFCGQNVQQKSRRSSAGGRGQGRGRGRAPDKKSPAKREKPGNATQKTADGEIELSVKTPQNSDGRVSEETPRKAGRPKKTPTEKTPAEKTPAKKVPASRTPSTDGGLPTGEGGDVDAVQQKNGTPKRKYVRKHPAKEAEPATDPCKEAQVEPPQAEPEEEAPGGRRRRSAAKVALRYLHILAKEVLNNPGEESGSQPGADDDQDPVREPLKGNRARKGRKRKRSDYESDPAEDEDFVPDADEDEVEDMEDEDEDEAEDLDMDFRTSGRSPATSNVNRTFVAGPSYKTSNGLPSNVMKNVWDATKTTKKFREEHYSSWVFPEWVPSISTWRPVPQSDLEKYLPQERQSAGFKVSRSGLSQEEPLQRLDRFGALPSHPERWDMLLFAGGPVWATEWCPTPDGMPASQYIALACHQGMEDQHYVNKMYAGSGLVQLWDVGKLECNSSPDCRPVLAYGLAQDKGFIWQLKWCPAGGWEPPSSGRKAPLLSRLGLLAVATSNGVVTIYSLPHPDALHGNKEQDNCAGQQLPIYKAAGVLTLKLGSFKAPRQECSGQVLSMDWLPEKPHNIMAIGFYDGVVGLWDLTTKSTLLKVREADRSISLLPYRCLLAHDHAVRALAFCPASRHLLVTAGEDRFVKTWDLRRLYNPITAVKRFLTNEVCWPLNAPGFMVAQESSYAAIGSHGIHFYDLSMRSYFAMPRTGTMWSISYTDWLNCVVTSDVLGEVILAVLPQICFSPQYVKRTLERRFPVYLTSLVPYDTAEEGEAGEAEGEGGAVEEQEGGGTEAPDVSASEGGSGSNNENGRDGERRNSPPPPRLHTYKEAVKKYYLHHTDNNMESFAGSAKRAVWKRMKNTEVKGKMNMDELPLAALHKVRFSPNLCSHTWVVSGGRTGLVRLNCLRGMISVPLKNGTSETKAHLNAPDSTEEQNQAVQTETGDL